MKKPKSIYAVGDICLGGKVRKVLNNNDSLFIFSGVDKVIPKEDLLFANLECSFCEEELSVEYMDMLKKERGDSIFHCNMKGLICLKQAGVDIVSLANNHVLDMGEEGLIELIDKLNSLEITAVGAGINFEQASKARFINSSPTIVCLSYYGISKSADVRKPGYNAAKHNKILNDIKNNIKADQIIIVSIHWGIPNRELPMEYQVKQAHEMIDQGATVILGSGPHVLQPVERYKNGVIAYSLGDFIFHHVGKSKLSMILKIDFDKFGVSNVKAIPTWRNEFFQPTIIDEDKEPKKYSTVTSLLVDRVENPLSDDLLGEMLFHEKEFSYGEVASKVIKNFRSYPLMYYLIGLKQIINKLKNKKN